MGRSLFSVLATRYGPPVDPESRRAFLKASLATGMGLLLSSGCARARQSRAVSDGKRIVVVGAGFSGLACAYELRSAGYDVTVVEARSRVGGRVLSFGDFIPGRNVEGGGELIGSNHPMWVAYAHRFGLEFLDVTEAEDAEFPITIGGARLTPDQSLALYEELDLVLATMNADARAVDALRPWTSANARALDHRSIGEWISTRECSALCRAALVAMLGGDNAQAVERQSYLGMLATVKGGGVEAYWTESEVYRCKGGNHQLASALAAELGSRITLGVGVRTIASHADSAIVTCADGRVLECDDVVLAVPPTVWPAIGFFPALPPELRPQMGTAVKQLSHVRRRFWKDRGLDPTSLSDGFITWTWDATDSQPGDQNACLTCFSGGPAAERARGFGADERAGAYASALEGTYPGFRANVVGSRFMDWPGDPLTRGGYSFPAPGEVTTVGPMLARPFGRIHFAGEHACPGFVGYMEGALQSGAGVARRIEARDRVSSRG